MRRFLRPVATPVALLILRIVFAYFRRVAIHQRVFSRGEDYDLGPGRAERYTVKRNVWGEPVGMYFLIRMDNDPDRLHRVDLTDVKLDPTRRQWHYHRPGTYDPEPRIPR